MKIYNFMEAKKLVVLKQTSAAEKMSLWHLAHQRDAESPNTKKAASKLVAVLTEDLEKEYPGFQKLPLD